MNLDEVEDFEKWSLEEEITRNEIIKNVPYMYTNKLSKEEYNQIEEYIKKYDTFLLYPELRWAKTWYKKESSEFTFLAFKKSIGQLEGDESIRYHNYLDRHPKAISVLKLWNAIGDVFREKKYRDESQELPLNETLISPNTKEGVSSSIDKMREKFLNKNTNEDDLKRKPT